VIFATCGSSHLPFHRMMEALAACDAAELYVQHGPAAPPPGVVAEPYLSFAEVVQRIEGARVVVSHAGVGSILCALRAGHTPIVFPRLKRFAETVDDHQAELARALAERGTVIAAWSPEELAAAVESAPPKRAAAEAGSDALHTAVHAAIIGGHRRSSRGRRQHAPAAWAER
jgi:UDP-N-acetylglucosamine transferase subunit ALG13